MHNTWYKDTIKSKDISIMLQTMAMGEYELCSGYTQQKCEEGHKTMPKHAINGPELVWCSQHLTHCASVWACYMRLSGVELTLAV